MIGKTSLSTAAASAISGIRRASDQMDQAAETVAASGVAASDTVTISADAKAGQGTDAVSALVDMRMARYAAAADVSVLRTVDEVSSDILGIVGRRRP
jgi:hypothetical protein